MSNVDFTERKARPADEEYWLSRMRQAALLTHEEQIACLDNLATLYKSSNNLEAAECSVTLILRLQTARFGYHSEQVVSATSKMAHIHFLQGATSQWMKRTKQAAEILKHVRRNRTSFEPLIPVTEIPQSIETILCDNYMQIIAPSDFLHESTWNERFLEASLALDQLFAA